MSMTFVLITLWYIIRVPYTKMFTWFFGYHHNVSIIILTMSMIWSRRREARNALGSSFVFETETETVRDQGTKGAKGHGGKGKLRFSADSGTEVWVVCGISSKCSIEMVGIPWKKTPSMRVVCPFCLRFLDPWDSWDEPQDLEDAVGPTFSKELLGEVGMFLLGDRKPNV